MKFGKKKNKTSRNADAVGASNASGTQNDFANNYKIRSVLTGHKADFDKQPKVNGRRKKRWPLWLSILLLPFLVIFFFFRLIFWLIRNPFTRYALLLVIALGVIGIVYLINQLPSPHNLTRSDNFAVSSQIFDRNGELLYEIYSDENRIPIELDTLPPYVYEATVAIEDQNFYKHFGFDIGGITRATIRNFKGESFEGGSTITQQLVKNALLSNERTYTRKIKEVVLAVLTELIYNKNEILEMYLNYISYGGTSVGIESASQNYFDKPAKDLTLAEASLLAGLPKAPTTYSPFGSKPETAKNRQRDVLRRMREDGYISGEEEQKAGEEVLTYALSKKDIKAPHFVFYVRDWLYQEYGEEVVEKGGLRVTTTLDLDLQNAAQASLSAEIDNLKGYSVGNGAALITKPNTGEILSMIGSKDYFNATDEGQVNVTLAKRQPGSSIKPITYAIAMQNKLLNPGSMLLDVPTCFEVIGQNPYCPKNYDGSFKGPVTIRQSLGNSLNIPAVKTLRIIGLNQYIKQAKELGIESWKDPSQYGLSLTLGGGELRMTELAQAFSVLADQGVKVPLTPILSVKTYDGKTLYEMSPDERIERLDLMNQGDDLHSSGDLTRVMSRAPAYLVSHIMQDNDARKAVFGPSSKLVIPDQVVSAKTGTTNDMKDNWTIGFTPEFLVVTWVGNNSGKPMNQRLVSGITGAAPIWNDIMSYVLKDQDPVWQTKPEDVTSDSICLTGMPPEQDKPCAVVGKELFWDKSHPSVAQKVQKEFWIDPNTGLPPPYGSQQEGLVLETHTFVQDPLTDFYCQDCNRAVDDQGRTQYERQLVKDDYQVGSSKYFDQ